MLHFGPVIVPQTQPSVSLKRIDRKGTHDLLKCQIILNGKATQMYLEHINGAEEAWVSMTPAKLTFGEATGGFSGAYSGTHTLAFLKYQGKLTYKTDYKVRYVKDRTALLVPFNQGVFFSNGPAYLYNAGKLFNLGQVYDVTDWTPKGIEGYLYLNEDGSDYTGPFNFDVENAVYKQSFIIHDGKRTLTTKTTVHARVKP